MAKIGDTVRFLNSVGGGRITRIDGAIAYVEEDGFETPVMIKECVVVSQAKDNEVKSVADRAFEASKNASQPPIPTKEVRPKEEEDPPFVETEEGEKLNVILAYSAIDLKRISTTDYEAYLVNDSNYYLYFTYLTKGDSDKGWTTRYAGMVEPATQVFLGEVLRSDLPSMDRIAIQYIPFKLGKEFTLKTMACVEQRLDATKFFRLHCFQTNVYFDDPVIAIPIIKNDMPTRQMEIDPMTLERAIKEKSVVDRHMRQRVQKRKPNPGEPIVVDLHIAELVDSTAGLSNADMLNLQVDKFREVMDANLKHHGQKIVFIHGKGEGVLRQAILKELNHRYKGHDVQDASFREYGFGATQVKIR